MVNECERWFFKMWKSPRLRRTYCILLHLSSIYILINILYLHCIFLSGCDLEEQLNCIAGSIGSIISVCRWSHPMWTHLFPPPKAAPTRKRKAEDEPPELVSSPQSPWIPGLFRISSGWCCLVWSHWPIPVGLLVISLDFPWSKFQGLAPTPHNESLERDRLAWCIRPGELGLVTRRYDIVWRRLGINNP